MVATLHQLGSVGLVEEHTKAIDEGKVSQKSLWIDDPTCWVPQRPKRCPSTSTQNRELSDRKETWVLRKTHDEVAAFVALLRASTKTKDLYKGITIHHDILKRGLLDNCLDALVTMYARCGALEKAQQLLCIHGSRNVFSWTALMAGHVQHYQAEHALDCFELMQHHGLSPDAVTFTCILKACGMVGATDVGERIHDEIVRLGLLQNDIVLGTALVDMYAKCGAITKSRRVLEELPCRDVVAWSAMITGYVQEGQGKEALECFEQMQNEGLSPDAVTFSCILKACGIIGAADKGEQVHDQIMRLGLLSNNVILGTALVDMYAKCGALVKARQMLEELPFRDVISWSSLIAGYAQKGQGEQALLCFEQLQQEGLVPDATTFSSVLNACSQLGLVEVGHMYFMDMSTKYGLTPDIEHYICMVDLFGRAGHLDKAAGVIRQMPSYDTCVVWSALLNSCCKWGDVNIGRWAFEQAIQADKSDATPYIIMHNIYTAAGMQDHAKVIQAMRRGKKAWKQSWFTDLS